MNDHAFAGSFGEIREQAEARRSRLARFFSPVYLQPTAAYPGVRKIEEDLAERTFKPNMLRLLLICGLFGAALCFMFYDVVGGNREGMDAANRGLIIGVVTAAAIIGIYRILRPQRYSITLDPQGISIGDLAHPWSSIRETAIMVVRAGKLHRHYLVLWFHNGAYVRYRLDNFTAFSLYGFPAVLSSWIEYFRKSS